ncbi:hypothetical protein S7335_4840 [Synechococcus sp. PCC 7335]|uniref:hypothetical protein n=1 Tax=Synechococcus sp. (strain ATCC 29403 / PCC 7335) TaxID=91464 RepID=UPI00017ED8EC|nr:hypothetical protein [Synechococcus sp. PCC 7335]EDX87133.1 hypothetical protein S7335_4840 [Synechococcus sp. PCC 7335]
MKAFLVEHTLRYLPLTMVTLLSAAMSAHSAEVVAGPTGTQFTLNQLPSGNYRFCSKKPDEVGQAMGACFRFRKEAENIVGTYYYPNTGSSICLRGQINNNTFSGQAIERFSTGESPPADFSRPQLSNWDVDFLKVGNGLYVDRLDRRDAILYRSALLNLNNFYQYNAGSVSPPTTCPTRPSSIVSVAPDFDNLREVGTSEYYGQPIYLDFSSIEPIASSTYRYTTLIGRPNRLSETEYQVDCQSLESVQVLRSRYYDQDGDLQELELVDKAVPVDQTSPFASQRYNAIQHVCQEHAQLDIELSRDTDSYERYRNQRFGYSLLYPSDVLIPQGELADGSGQTFLSAAGDVLVRVYGESSQSETLAQRYEQAQVAQRVTYRAISDNFFVVSGVDNDKVVYRKTLLEDNIFKVLEIEFDQALQREFEPVAQAIADSFAPTVPDSGLRQLPEAVQTAVLELAAANTEAESAVFEIVSVEEETWSNGCLDLPQPDEVCTLALVPGWRVKVAANLPGGLIQFTYRTDQTGDRIRFEN